MNFLAKIRGLVRRVGVKVLRVFFSFLLLIVKVFRRVSFKLYQLTRVNKVFGHKCQRRLFLCYERLDDLVAIVNNLKVRTFEKDCHFSYFCLLSAHAQQLYAQIQEIRSRSYKREA